MNQKLSKSVLKEIVKECLVEILSEGLVSAGKSKKKKRNIAESLDYSNKRERQIIKSRNLNAMQGESKTVPKRRPKSYLDNISYDNVSEQSDHNQSEIAQNYHKNMANKQIDQIDTAITNDTVLNDLLADTARTTLANQHSAEKGGMIQTEPADNAARIVGNSNITELFSESAHKWATLAFGQNIKS